MQIPEIDHEDDDDDLLYEETMAELEAVRRQCCGKIGYDSEQDAEDSAEEMRLRYGWRQRSYKCGVGTWHLSSARN